jgi:hypothetical protein
MSSLLHRVKRLGGRAVRLVWPGFRRPVVHGTAVPTAQPAPAPSPPAPRPLPNKIALSRLMAPGDDRYVVFFAPEAGVVPYYIAHCVVAKTLEELGYRTLIVQCFDVYPRCIVMDAESLPHHLSAEQRSSVCATCHRYSNDMASAYGLNVVDLRELADDNVHCKVDALMADLPDDLSTFEIEGSRIGKFCGAEAAVTFKTTDFAGTTPQVRGLLVQYLKGALLSHFAMQRLLASGKVARVVHFNEYAIMLSAALVARRAGVPTTFMTMASIRGVDRRRLVFMSDLLAIVGHRNKLNDWPAWRDLCLTPEMVADIGDDCLFRISGNSVMVYSPVRTGSTDTVFEQLGLSSDRKLIVAFTSSLDEVAANDQYLGALNCEPFSENQPFRDQIEWLTALVEKVEGSDDLQLVVRIHPREGANRRESVVSNHLGQLKSHFLKPFKHVRFVWPGDDVSSYDLMELADIGLSSWSSTALEMTRFGVPTAIAFDIHTPFPIGDVMRWSATPEGYFRLLHGLLDQPVSLDRIRFAFRWTWLRTLGSSFDFGDIIPDQNCGVLPPFVTPAVASDVEDVLVHGGAAVDINYKRLVAAQHGQSARREEEELLRQLRRAVWLMCTGEDRRDDYRLCYSELPFTSVPEGYDAVLGRDGGFVELRTQDRLIRRRSRMVQRLAAFAASRIDLATA